MHRTLFLCNSVYQVLVAIWMKHILLPDKTADIIITDHMNDGYGIHKRLINDTSFSKVYYAKCFDYARRRLKLSETEQKQLKRDPNAFLKKFILLEDEYTDFFTASLDPFAQLLYGYIKTRNRNAGVSLFEDGLYTYSKLMEEDYFNTQIPVNDFVHRFVHKFIYKRKYIYGNIKRLYLFNPKYIAWKPDFEIDEIPKISCSDLSFKELCNRVFQYGENTDSYDRKYIFMEESFYAEGTPVNDIELLNKLSQKVGKENVMVKIHPRNPVNRFKDEGYKTNTNTAIPWELIIMNNDDLEEKILITISSSSVLNPILIFNKRIKTYSLHRLVTEKAKSSRLLSGDFWELNKRLFEENSDTITICNSVDEIE